MIGTSEFLGPRHGVSHIDVMCLGALLKGDVRLGCLQALDRNGSTTESQSLFHGFSQALARIASKSDSVESEVDVMAEILLEGGWIIEGDLAPVHATSEQALFDELLEQVHVGALLRSNNRTPNGDCMSFEMPDDVIDDFLNGPPRHLSSTFGTVRTANSGPEQAEVIHDLRHRRNR